MQYTYIYIYICILHKSTSALLELKLLPMPVLQANGINVYPT